MKDEVDSTEWRSLTDVCVAALRNKWSGKSHSEILDYIENNIQYIAEHLRNDASNCLIDGTAAKFSIDDENPPYVKAIGAATSGLLTKLRSISPYIVEAVCAKILTAFGANAQSTQRTSDGGVDFIAIGLNILPDTYPVPIGSKTTIIGQTKRYKEGNAVTEKHMREFVGAGLLRKHILQTDKKIAALTPVIFAFWTTSDFEPNAKRYARDVGMWFMDGHTMATYIHALNMTDEIMLLPDYPTVIPAVIRRLDE